MTNDIPDTPRDSAAGSPRVAARAPGRVNLIGDHTDYTGGLVMPLAIHLDTRVRGSRRPQDGLKATSTTLNETHELPREAIDPAGLPAWTRYVYGVFQLLLRESATPPGAELLIESDIPPGAGLASSAALEVAVALALCALRGRSLPLPELARLCQRAENDFAGSPCGIMDQTVSACARIRHALMIDCRDLRMEHVPLILDPAGIVVIDTGVRHSIAGVEYAARRRECDDALAMLRTTRPAIQVLRDVAESDLAACHALPELLRRRVRHVVRENGRVIAARDCLVAGDLAGLGGLMLASHESLRDDYAVSCVELDTVVDVAMRTPGVYGARMTGGGFGGCAVCVVDREHVGDLRRHIAEAYDRPFGRQARIIPVTPAFGASILPGA